MRVHIDKLALSRTELVHDRAYARLGHVDKHAVDGLALYAVDILDEHLRHADGKLIAVAPHVLYKYRQMHFAPAAHYETVRRRAVGNAERQILDRLLVQPVAQVTARNVLALLAGERRVVDHERHFDARLGYLDELYRRGVRFRAHRVAYHHAVYARHAHDIADRRDVRGRALDAVVREYTYDLALDRLIGLVVVSQHDAVADRQSALAYLADVLVMLRGRNEHLERLVRTARRRGDMLYYRLEQRLHTASALRDIARRGAVARRRENKRAVQLFLARVEVEEKLEYLVDDFFEPRVGSVRLVDDDYYFQPERERAFEHEPRLRHRTFESVDYEQSAVDHFEHALDLAAEVGVPGRVDDVYLEPVVHTRRVFGQYGYTALAFERVGIHHPVGDGLIVAEHVALLEKLVDERGLAVVDVRYYRYVSYPVAFHIVCSLFFDFTIVPECI